ncbi:MAG: hypothetical protein Q8R70_09370 [Methanoregula sp.]|nr:hypothetical protein [Methanoregula sp.]
MDGITLKVEMSDEVEKQIQAAVNETVGKAMSALSGDLTRLTSLVGQIEGDVNTMVGRMQEARGIVQSMNTNAAALNLLKTKEAPAAAVVVVEEPVS